MTFDDWWSAYPTQDDYEANCRDAWEASAAIRDDEVAELLHHVAEAQAQSARRLEGLYECGIEKDQLRQQVTLLRDACHELMMLPNKYPGHREMASIAIITKVLATTEQKP